MKIKVGGKWTPVLCVNGVEFAYAVCEECGMPMSSGMDATCLDVHDDGIACGNCGTQFEVRQ